MHSSTLAIIQASTTPRKSSLLGFLKFLFVFLTYHTFVRTDRASCLNSYLIDMMIYDMN